MIYVVLHCERKKKIVFHVGMFHIEEFFINCKIVYEVFFSETQMNLENTTASSIF